MPSKKFYQLIKNNKNPNFYVKNYINNCYIFSWFIILTCSILTLFFLTLIPSKLFPNFRCLTPYLSLNLVRPEPDPCNGSYIYILDLPTQFNTDFLKNCTDLNSNSFTDECKTLSNSGLGPRLKFSKNKTVFSRFSKFSNSNWFETDQFSLELIFHNRMKQYKCLTKNYSNSNAIYIPFYPSLDLRRNLFSPNATLRDEFSTKLTGFLTRRPEWKRFGGRDHFLIAGRTTWDFSRKTEDLSSVSIGWGNKLLEIPEIKNITTLILEANPTSKSQIGIPYPSFFHPSIEEELENFLEKTRKKNRHTLFSFVGAPRPDTPTGINRNLIIKQCKSSIHCEFLNIDKNSKSKSEPKPVNSEDMIELFLDSDFCLQPPGDTLTRKSTFDSMLSGCIPVFFHPGSAYIHYLWHLPRNYSSYSVFIPMNEVKQGKVSIEKVLLGFSKEKIREMREEVIKLIPKIIYANPNTEIEGFEDGFDVAINGVLSRVEGIKDEINGGKKIGLFENIPNFFAWKYNFFGDMNNHEWDKYFTF